VRRRKHSMSLLRRPSAMLAIAALMIVAGTACSSSSNTSSNTSSTTRPPTRNAASLLGTAHRATGTPVKIGLLTTGGQCTGCTSNDETPAARAAIGWLNDYENRLAGHPITLDVCVDKNDPGTGADCANQMISDNVNAVVLGSSGVTETEWKLLHDA